MCLATSTPTTIATTNMAANKPKKQVIFAGVTGEAEAPRNYRITKTQKSLCYYNKAEMNQFKTDIKIILKSDNKIDETTDCFRGIEAYVNRNRSKANKSYSAAILRTQAENEEMGMEDPTGLRCYSVCLSRNSTRAGILRAAQDAVEAYQIYTETSASKVEFDFKQTLTGFAAPMRRPRMARSA